MTGKGKDKLAGAMERSSEAAEEEAEDRFQRADKHWTGTSAGEETGSAKSYNPSTGRRKKQVIFSLTEEERAMVEQLQDRADQLRLRTPNRSQVAVAAFKALMDLPDEDFEQLMRKMQDRD